MMQLFSSFPWMRRFASGFAIVSIALVFMAPLAACGGSKSADGGDIRGGRRRDRRREADHMADTERSGSGSDAYGGGDHGRCR